MGKNEVEIGVFFKNVGLRKNKVVKVEVFNLREDAGRATSFLVMKSELYEVLPYQLYKEIMMKLERKGGKYFEDDAKAVLIQTLNVVAFCHLRRVVNRELKPKGVWERVGKPCYGVPTDMRRRSSDHVVAAIAHGVEISPRVDSLVEKIQLVTMCPELATGHAFVFTELVQHFPRGIGFVEALIYPYAALDKDYWHIKGSGELWKAKACTGMSTCNFSTSVRLHIY
ncbi:putative terpene synthase 3 [Artemisia annua]|uniref:Putative terpene synthase 3 n=1 Tax=Artemisia annua TaxID=35608 RepID=A0A2U1L4U2_ARTAN|nr:putative terpene synthase 3 [Artemisia annua]